MSIFSDIRDWFRRRPQPPPQPPIPLPPSLVDDLLAAHNQFRAVHGLPPLIANAKLAMAAQGHVEWMARTGTLSHQEGFRDFSSRITAQGYVFTACAENIADGQRTVAEVMASWETSPGHRANILGPYKDFGFGKAFASDGTVYWCVDFAA